MVLQACNLKIFNAEISLNKNALLSLSLQKRGSKVAKNAKKKGLSLAKMSNIQKYKRAKRGECTQAEKKQKKMEKKAKRKVTYAELHNERRRIDLLKAKYAAEEEVYPLTAEVTGK